MGQIETYKAAHPNVNWLPSGASSSSGSTSSTSSGSTSSPSSSSTSSANVYVNPITGAKISVAPGKTPPIGFQPVWTTNVSTNQGKVGGGGGGSSIIPTANINYSPAPGTTAQQNQQIANFLNATDIGKQQMQTIQQGNILQRTGLAFGGLTSGQYGLGRGYEIITGQEQKGRKSYELASQLAQGTSGGLIKTVQPINAQRVSISYVNPNIKENRPYTESELMQWAGPFSKIKGRATEIEMARQNQMDYDKTASQYITPIVQTQSDISNKVLEYTKNTEQERINNLISSGKITTQEKLDKEIDKSNTKLENARVEETKVLNDVVNNKLKN
jgi:hypothetical protein